MVRGLDRIQLVFAQLFQNGRFQQAFQVAQIKEETNLILLFTGPIMNILFDAFPPRVAHSNCSLIAPSFTVSNILNSTFHHPVIYKGAFHQHHKLNISITINPFFIIHISNNLSNLTQEKKPFSQCYFYLHQQNYSYQVVQLSNSIQRCFSLVRKSITERRFRSLGEQMFCNIQERHQNFAEWTFHNLKAFTYSRMGSSICILQFQTEVLLLTNIPSNSQKSSEIQAKDVQFHLRESHTLQQCQGSQYFSISQATMR